MSDASLRELRLDLPAVHRAVRVARSTVRRFARLEGVGERDLDTLLLVLSELLANAVDHGGGERAMQEGEGAASVRMRAVVALGEATWSVSVTDQGGGDPGPLRALVASDEPPDLEDERGRGFFLMKELTDTLAVERSEDGRGLVVVAAKHYEGR